jgi:hypothetical protein
MKRTTAGVFLARLLAVVLAGAAILGFWLTYNTMRNLDGGLHGACDVMGSFCLAVPACLLGLLLVLFLRLLRAPRRESLAAFLCWMCMAGGFLAGAGRAVAVGSRVREEPAAG